MSAAARTRPHYGGVLRVEVDGDAWEAHGLARKLVLDGLTRMDERGNVQPALAVEWKADSGYHRWQFKLRPGVHFSDGSPLTSQLVAEELDRGKALSPWTAVKAVGSSVVFTGDSPMPELPELLASDDFRISLTPKSGGQLSEPIVGTGPFQVSGSSNGVLTLTANEGCWLGRPFADSVEIREHQHIREQWLDLSVGRADVVQVPPERLPQAQQQRLTVLTSRPIKLLALRLGLVGGYLENPVLRQSVALTVDRAAIENVIFQKQGEVTGSLLPSAMTGYSFLFPTDRDLEKARALRGGLRPPISVIASGSEFQEGASALAEQRLVLNLKEAGFETVNGGTLCCEVMLRWLMVESPGPQAGLDEILRGALMEPVPTDGSPAAVYQAERDILRNGWLIPLLYVPRSYAVGPRVRDLRLGLDGLPELADASLTDAGKEAAP